MYFKRNIQDRKNRINGCRPVLNLTGAALFFVCQYQNDGLLFQYHDVIGYLLNLFSLAKHESCWAFVVVFFSSKRTYTTSSSSVLSSSSISSSAATAAESASVTAPKWSSCYFSVDISDQINTIKYINALRARLSSSGLIEKNSKNPLGHHNWFTRTVFFHLLFFPLFLFFPLNSLSFLLLLLFKWLLFLEKRIRVMMTVSQLIISFCTLL